MPDRDRSCWALVRATSTSWRTEQTRACSHSSASLAAQATSARARTLSKLMSPSPRAPTRWGSSAAFSPTRVNARAVGPEIPKRSAAQDSLDVAPSSTKAARRPSSPKEATMTASAAAFWRKASSSMASSSTVDFVATAPTTSAAPAWVP